MCPRANSISIGSTVFARPTLVTNKHADRPRYLWNNRPHQVPCTAKRANEQASQICSSCAGFAQTECDWNWEREVWSSSPIKERRQDPSEPDWITEHAHRVAKSIQWPIQKFLLGERTGGIRGLCTQRSAGGRVPAGDLGAKSRRSWGTSAFCVKKIHWQQSKTFLRVFPTSSDGVKTCWHRYETKLRHCLCATREYWFSLFVSQCV